MKKEDLEDAALKGDSLMAGEEVSQHLGRSDGAVAEIQKSQVG